VEILPEEAGSYLTRRGRDPLTYVHLKPVLQTELVIPKGNPDVEIAS